MHHSFLSLLPIFAFVLLLIVGSVFIYFDTERRIARKQAQDKAVLDVIEYVEIHLRQKDGTLQSKVLRGDDAKKWWKRWVFRYRRTDVSNLAWKISPVTETKEIQWP